MRRLNPWIVAVALLALVTAGGVTAAALALGTASAFVRVYVDALASGDVRGALALPGASPGARATAAAASLGAAELRVDGTSERQDGARRVVTVAWSASGQSFTSELAVVPEGLGWRFQTPPFARATITAVPARTVTVGVARLATDDDGRRDVELPVPGAYLASVDDGVAEAAALELTADRVGARVAATLRIAAAPGLERTAESAARARLGECAREQVLQPAGCPFGYVLTDRLVGAPSWRIEQEPTLALSPGTAPGEWVLAVSGGTARVIGEVQSIADGSERTLDVPVVIAGDWTIEVAANGALSLGALG